jgi:hypothetical protein
MVSLGNDSTVCDFNFPIVIQAAGNSSFIYNWSNGLIGQSISLNSAGTYSVTITDNNGCQAIDDIVIISDPCANINEDEISILIYPNPFTSAIEILSTGFISAKIEVYNSEGRLVFQQKMNDVKSTLQLQELSPGTYFVKMEYNNKTKITNLVKW